MKGRKALEKFSVWEAPFIDRPTPFPANHAAKRGPLEKYFDWGEFGERLEKFQNGTLGLHTNWFPKDHLRAPQASDFHQIDPAQFKDLQALGWEAVSKGLVAMLILAGGTSSRLKDNKIFLEIFPGKSLLYLKYMTVRGISERRGLPMVTCIMTSPFTTEAVVNDLTRHGIQEGRDYLIFEQPIAPRVNEKGQIITYHGEVQFDVTGHGALFASMQESGIIQKLMSWGIKTIVQSNTDNPLVVMDARPESPFLATIGYHTENRCRVTAQVTSREDPYKGGSPLWYQRQDGNWKMVVLEETQIDRDFLENLVTPLPYFNPLTLIYDLKVVKEFDSSKLPVLVVKRTEGSEGKPFDFFRFETASGSITLFEETHFLPDTIPGISEEGMFAQLKDEEQLPHFRNLVQTRLQAILPEM